MGKPPVNYGVYLVTDSTPAILGTGDLCAIVAAAVRGGVTCVQYRDKHSGHDVVVDTARRLHAITRPLGVPLLINDRVDVALEVGCEGVHIGQDDMEYQQARNLLGPDKIIGVSAGSIQEALKACEAGADYLGIGAVFATPTKKDTKTILGPSGLRSILSALASSGHAAVPTVCIGGVNGSNARAVLVDSSTPTKTLDGVAVVSAIVAAPDPAAAARHLLAEVLAAKVPGVIRAVAHLSPLSHNITNMVVQNFAANIALAVGASPIMANEAAEAEDLAKLGGALVINMGSLSKGQINNYLAAVKAYNAVGRPVVFDPVGAGASALRRQTVKDLLSSGHFDVIKGNEGEIQTVYGATITQKGVDSTSSLTLPQKAALVSTLARRENNVVVLTGVTDVLSDGTRTLRIDNGHEYLGMVTGTGCTLGTVISAMVAACPGDKLLAAAAGAAMFGVAAEMAAGRAEVRGPGTFVPAFIDELYAIRKATAEGDMRWMVMAKIQAIEVDEGLI
ncbi:Hydroxyethylthiazole kinase family-domain-containing protein [Stachybotrys elegans]|uniref:Hydroxyethylthiazole kinase family-domain-containing protein n=1 Tax=Stachybotrys elegans TaxID=80388 RepID=A0A8K0T345_9HYPO|nr:Hydroxyethylthiazole kinase family-domain-containing protein [Stachybotrys elegans]